MKGRRRGASLIEVLAASLLVSVAVAGAFTLWQASLENVHNTTRENIGAEIARADLEKAKAQGFNNLPVGTYDANAGYGQYLAAIEYYDASGAKLADNAPVSDRKYSLQRTIRDYDVYTNGLNSTYALAADSIRRVTADVRRTTDNYLVVSIGINLVRGGV